MAGRDRELVWLGKHANGGMAQLEVVMAPSIRLYSSQVYSPQCQSMQGTMLLHASSVVRSLRCTGSVPTFLTLLILRPSRGLFVTIDVQVTLLAFRCLAAGYRSPGLSRSTHSCSDS